MGDYPITKADYQDPSDEPVGKIATPLFTKNRTKEDLVESGQSSIVDAQGILESEEKTIEAEEQQIARRQPVPTGMTIQGTKDTTFVWSGAVLLIAVLLIGAWITRH